MDHFSHPDAALLSPLLSVATLGAQLGAIRRANAMVPADVRFVARSSTNDAPETAGNQYCRELAELSCMRKEVLAVASDRSIATKAGRLPHGNRDECRTVNGQKRNK
jgi:hypothetical protein